MCTICSVRISSSFHLYSHTGNVSVVNTVKSKTTMSQRHLLIYTPGTPVSQLRGVVE